MRNDEQTISEFAKWLKENFTNLNFLIKKPLYELFPEPKKFKGFWKHKQAHADISVFRHGKLVCIIEPGGFQHLTDKDQIKRDKKKKYICNENKVNFLPLMNNCLENKDYKEFKRMLKAYFYTERK